MAGRGEPHSPQVVHLMIYELHVIHREYAEYKDNRIIKLAYYTTICIYNLYLHVIGCAPYIVL